jgi:hypothetical protein
MEMGRGGGQHKEEERGSGRLHTRGKKRGAARVGGRKRVGSPLNRDQRPKIAHTPVLPSPAYTTNINSTVFLRFSSQNSNPLKRTTRKRKKQRKYKLQLLFFADWVSQGKIGREGGGGGQRGGKGGGEAATIGEQEWGSARVGEERGAPINRIKINGPNSLSHLSSRPQRKKCQKIYYFLRNAS